MTATAMATPDAPVIRLINPATGVTFEYTGRWLRNGKATDNDVRAGRARFRGDQVWLNLPPGVVKQLEKGVLRYASEYDAQSAVLAPAPGAEPDYEMLGLPGGMAMPSPRAGHGAWVNYAIAHGMPAEAAAGMTRDQIRAALSDPRDSGVGSVPDLEQFDQDPDAIAARRAR